ncbi:MAG: MFS transporter [Acetobacteraceae bacterium]|jgi:ACS family glucarate transporter-like MFS transporter
MSATQLGTRPTSDVADRPRVSKRRVFIYALLFAMTAVNYTDRVNLSVSAGLISHEFGLSPAELGWLLSAYLWPYIICLAPAGLLVDWLGYRLVGWAAVGFWSLCTVATAFVRAPFPFYLTRIGLGGAEAANFPIGTQAIRAWAPRNEYGVSVASLSLGQWFGTAFGAMFVGWVVSYLGWRAAFVLTGVLGLVWVAIWAVFVRDPQRAGWLGSEERTYILKEREARPPQQAGGANVKALLSSRSLWALSLAQGCFVYEAYMLLSWLPNFLQTQHHVSIFSSGGYTAIIYGTAVVGSILLARLSDRIFSTTALRGGARKWVVAFSYLPAMLVAVVPQVNSVWLIVALLTVSVTFLANGISLNTALCNDLVVRPADAGTAVALFTLGANLVGFVSPIVTGYVVQATGNFNMAFVLTGVMLLAGVAILLGMIKGGIGTAEPSLHPGG